MYKSITELADELRVSRMTVWRWTRRLGVELIPDRYDARVRLIRPEDQERIRQVINRREWIPMYE